MGLGLAEAVGLGDGVAGPTDQENAMMLGLYDEWVYA